MSATSRALWALALGGFAFGTGEFVSMGLLPDIARDAGVSIPAAGHLISLYALGVMLGAPVLAVCTARWRRRPLLMALTAGYALANLGTGVAPGFAAVSVLRLAAGLPHGTYFGVAALVGAALVPPGQRARAVGLVMLGLTGAMLLGAPLATWVGQQFGWHAAFVLVGLVAACATLLIRYAVPDLPAVQTVSPLRELGALARPQVWLTLGIAAIGFGGMFCVFSYIKPTLTEVSGISVGHIPLLLALFGLGGVAGNLLGARLADRALLPSIGGVLLYAVLVLLGFVTLVHSAAGAALAVFLLGSTVALGPALQIRLMDVAGDAQTLAAALNHSAFNLANALGAWLGGMAIAAGLGWAATGYIGALLAVGGLLIFFASCAVSDVKAHTTA